MQPDCLKGRIVCGTVYGDMHLKDLLGSIARVGYCIPVQDNQSISTLTLSDGVFQVGVVAVNVIGDDVNTLNSLVSVSV